MKFERVLLIMVFSLLSLVSCRSVDASPAAVITPSLLDNPTIANASTSMPPSTSTVIPEVPVDVLGYEQLDIQEEIPVNMEPTGCVFLARGRFSYFYDFGEGTLQPMSEDRHFTSVSPDGNWLSYVEVDNENPNRGGWLVVENTNGEQGRIAIQSTWYYAAPPLWFDRQRFMLSMYSEQSYPAMDIVVINPFSGEVQELVTDYPNLDTEVHRYLPVSYDRRLELVIYHAFDPERLTVLWDRIDRKRIASFSLYGYSFPLWLPDDSGALVSASPERNTPEEWFKISREGEITQLTNFGASFDDASISYYFMELSPNGRYLAFTLETSPNYCDPNAYTYSNLTILDLESLQATDYCIPGGKIIWSPDSQYLVIDQAHDENSSRIVLVAPFEGWAAPIAVDDGLAATGWWSNP